MIQSYKGLVMGSAAEQVLLSFINVVPVFIAASRLGSQSLGEITIVLSFIFSAQALSRASGGEVLQVFCTAGDGPHRSDTGAVVRVAATIGLLVALALVGYSLAVGTIELQTAIAGGTVAMLVLVFDARRAISVAHGDTSARVKASVSAFILQIVLLVILWATGALSTDGLLWCWGASLAIGSAIGHRAPLWPGGSLRQWVVRWPRAIATYVLDALGSSVGPQVVFVALASALSVTQLGGLRATLLLLTPITVVHMAASQLVYREAAKHPTRPQTFSIGYQAAMAAWVTVVGVSLWLLPDRILESVVGDSLELARRVMFPCVLYIGASALMMGPVAALRVQSAAARFVMVRWMLLPFVVALPLIFATRGLEASVLCLAIPNLTLLVVANWLLFRKVAGRALVDSSEVRTV